MLLYFGVIFASVCLAKPCNPSLQPCLARNRALAKEVEELFPASSPYFTASMNLPQVEYGESGARLSIFSRFDNPLLTSNTYILYGKVEAEIEASSGSGIISSLYLQSDDLDEIDVAEVFGGNRVNYATNFFVKGNTTTYDRGEYHDYFSTTNSHTYGLEWKRDAIVWFLDGVAVRTLSSDNPHGFPCSPMKVVLSLWAGGDHDNHPGTIEWAGGETDYSKLPFLTTIRRVKVADYSVGLEYVYSKSVPVKVYNGLKSEVGAQLDEEDVWSQWENGHVPSRSSVFGVSATAVMIAIAQFFW